MYYKNLGFEIPDNVIFEIRFLKYEDFHSLAFNKKNYTVVAEDDVGNLVGVSAADSKVYFLDTCEKTELYAAKSLQTFIAELKLAGNWQRPDDNASNEIWQADTRQFVQRIENLDKDALADKESYWSLIVEQMEDGLL